MARGKAGRGYLKNLTREELYRMYHEEQLSQWQIAERLDVTQGAVLYWMRKWEIPARSHDDSLMVLGKSGRFTGDKNPRWTGGRHISPNGYIMLRRPDHPKADRRGYVREHVVVWEEANGIPVPDGWDVHHKNGDKADNRPENLEAMPPKSHKDVIPALLRRIAELEARVRRLESEHREGSHGEAGPRGLDARADSPHQNHDL